MMGLYPLTSVRRLTSFLRQVSGRLLTCWAESIWDLITVSEWVVRVLAGVMKESIIEAGRMEWTDDMGLDQPVQPEDGEF